MGQKYIIKKIAIDNFRYALMKDALENRLDPRKEKSISS